MKTDNLFDHLTSIEFEEFTYDLLQALGFVNLDWRKGSGKSGHSADQGKDIEAEKHIKEVDGNESFEKYLVQCKHYKAGVPPQKLNDAVTWATTERPSVLLFVVSNFLSNSAKNWIKEYENNNNLTFKIRVWEKKKLERLLMTQPMIIEKYRLNPSSISLNLHPAHMEYVAKPHLNTLEQLFKALDTLEPPERDEILSFAYHAVINPQFRKSINEGERVGDLMIDKVDYFSFRAKCQELRGEIQEIFLVHSIVTETLSWLCHFSNPTNNLKMIKNNQEVLSYLEEFPEKKCKSIIKLAQKQIVNAPEILKKWDTCYKLFCENVLPNLLIDDINLLENS